MSVVVNWQPGSTLESIEKEAILQAFRFFRSNKSQTAIALGIAVRTLDVKLEEYANQKVKMEEVEDERRKKDADFDLRRRGLAPACVSDSGYASGQAEKNVPSPNAGVRVESAPHPPAQPTVPMPKRVEVQNLPHAHSSQGHSRKAR